MEDLPKSSLKPFSICLAEARALDSLGGGHILRSLDSLGGGHILRQLDSLGGGNILRGLDEPTLLAALYRHHQLKRGFDPMRQGYDY